MAEYGYGSGLAEHRYAREYLLPGYGLTVPGWFADELEKQVGNHLANEPRGTARHEALLALRHAALEHRAGYATGSADVTTFADDATDQPPSIHDMDLVDVNLAAAIAGIDPAAIRRACRDRRLASVKIGNSYAITRTDAQNYANGVARRRAG